MTAAVGMARFPLVLDSVRLARLLDRIFIFGSIILIPYDLPLIHQACMPLAIIAIMLITVRGDLVPFLAFLRTLPLPALLALAFCALSLISIFCNIESIMNALFQQEAGWTRALVQAVLLMITAIFPFYFAFCLRRHGDWEALIVRAAWWSLPIPLLVGFLQIANLLHVPGVAHLPYVGGSFQDGSFWRLTSVARESSWFGSFACVILPFLIMSVSRMQGWKRGAGIGAIATVLFFVVLGTSKSAFAALAVEAGIAALVYSAIWKPWRTCSKAMFGLLFLLTVLFVLAILAPAVFERISAPVVGKARVLYFIFEPLIAQDTKFVSISTRFGMSTAGIAMGEAHPLAGVGLGQFGFHVYNYTPLWGLNGETLVWLSNDTKAWPSTSNLYTRLIGEIGPLGCFVYIAFRVALLLGMGARLLRKDSITRSRDLCVFSAMTALLAFDFHRDSFINLDMWAVLGMALACWQDIASPRIAEPAAGWRTGRIFLAATALSFCASLGDLLFAPATFQASATLAPKSSGILIAAGDASGNDDANASPSVGPDYNGNYRFGKLRTYWASTTVAARIIAAHPDLARAVMGNQPVTPMTLANYIKDNVTVLMADKQTTLTLQYRNRDAGLAQRFLAIAIAETDRTIAVAYAASGSQAAQLLLIALDSSPDISARQALIAHVAAQELQSGFDTAGSHASFDYVEQPGISSASQSPQPVRALPFAMGLALLAGALAVAGYLLMSVMRFKAD